MLTIRTKFLCHIWPNTRNLMQICGPCSLISINICFSSITENFTFSFIRPWWTLKQKGNKKIVPWLIRYDNSVYPFVSLFEVEVIPHGARVRRLCASGYRHCSFWICITTNWFHAPHQSFMPFELDRHSRDSVLAPPVLDTSPLICKFMDVLDPTVLSQVYQFVSIQKLKAG